MTPGTRKVSAVLRLEEGDQGNLAHRSLKVPAALLIGSHGEDVVQFGLIFEPTSQLGQVEDAGVYVSKMDEIPSQLFRLW
jgi:hypothetical protein